MKTTATVRVRFDDGREIDVKPEDIFWQNDELETWPEVEDQPITIL